jgi:hypothetical protein
MAKVFEVLDAGAESDEGDVGNVGVIDRHKDILGDAEGDGEDLLSSMSFIFSSERHLG